MKHNLGDTNRIIHILEAITNIEVFLQNVALDSFVNNIEKRAAIERMLEIIGEATNHISEEVLYNNEYSSSWRKIIAPKKYYCSRIF
jgi:uncharacterized protein with HEPN domain